MNKRLSLNLLVLVIILSLTTKAIAATTETYQSRWSTSLTKDGIKHHFHFGWSGKEVQNPISSQLTLTNIVSKKKVILTEEELLEYVDSGEDFDNIVIGTSGGFYDDYLGNWVDFRNDSGDLNTPLGVGMEFANDHGGVPVYYADNAPVVVTLEGPSPMFSFYCFSQNSQDYIEDEREFVNIFESEEYPNKEWDLKNLRTHDIVEGNKKAEVWVYMQGSSYTLQKPGKYLFVLGNLSGYIDVFCVDIGHTPTNIVSKLNVSPTASTVLVNNKVIEFESYTIEGNNYFKLRDLAQAINKTEKNFGVVWDNEKNAINLISNETYTSTGGELAKGDGKSKVATQSIATINKDGVKVPLKAYTINGNNFFKLRDIAEAFNIGVTWDNDTKTIGIDTSAEYTKE